MKPHFFLLLVATCLLSACTTITYPDGTVVSTPYVAPAYGYGYPCGYGGGYPVSSTCGVGMYTGGYYPVYGNCFGSGWNTWGGWGWNRGCGYANNSGNTTITVNRTSTFNGGHPPMNHRSMSGSYGGPRPLYAGGMRGMR